MGVDPLLRILIQLHDLRCLMIENLDDVKTEIRFHHRTDCVLFLGECGILKGFDHLAAGKGSEIPADLFARTIGIFCGQIGKIGALQKLLPKIFGLCLFFRQVLFRILRRLASPESAARERFPVS